MEIEFGYIKKYKIEKGFGFLSRTFKNPNEKVWFHISKVKSKYPELAQKLDSGSCLGVKIWYEIGNVNGRDQAIEIWLESQSIPDDKRNELIKFVEDIWSEISMQSSPKWLHKITIDLVGEARKNELLNNHLIANKKQEDQKIKRYKDNEPNGDDWDSHPLLRYRKMKEERRKRRENISLEYSVPRSGETKGRGLSPLLEIVVPTKEATLFRGTEHLNNNNKSSNGKDSRIDEVGRLARRYRLTNAEAEEFHQLLVEMRPLGFKRSKQLSKYIVDNKLGLKYKNISGILRMEYEGETWDFRGGFPPGIYRIICKELELGNQGTKARPVKFTPFKDIY